MSKRLFTTMEKFEIGKAFSEHAKGGGDVNKFFFNGEHLPLRTCKDCAGYYEGVIALDRAIPGEAQKILSGKIKISSGTVQCFAKETDKEIQESYMLARKNHGRSLTTSELYDLGKHINCINKSSGESYQTIAKKKGISVGRAYAARYCFETVERVGSVSPDIKEKVLSGELEITQEEINTLRKLSGPEACSEIKAIYNAARNETDIQKEAEESLADFVRDEASSMKESFWSTISKNRRMSDAVCKISDDSPVYSVIDECLGDIAGEYRKMILERKSSNEKI